MKIKNYIFAVFSLFVILFNCSQPNEPKPEKGKIYLTAETVAASFVRFKLEITSEQKYDGFEVFRGDSLIINSNITGRDTVFYDAVLNASSNYNYKAHLLKNSKIIDTSSTVQVTTNGISGNQFEWQIDTLGILGGTLYDVDAVSDSSVWAVGAADLEIPDTLGHDNTRVNVIHWTNKGYEFHQVYIESYAGTYGLNELYAVIAFSDDDVWVFPAADSYAHWDGTEWKSEYKEVPPVEAVWGTDSNNIYIAGRYGKITHFNGSEFIPMESGVEEDLNDIAGVVDPETGKMRIWAIGHKTILYSEGESWEKIQSIDFPEYPDSDQVPRAIYIPNDKDLFLITYHYYEAKLYVIDQFNHNNFKKLANIIPYYPFSLDGKGTENIFTVGAETKVLQYNGQQFNIFEETVGTGNLRAVDFTGNSVFVAGGNSAYQAVFMCGTKR